ncbi:uncharacterized protein LTR77_008359 [Saxophila tyrrhenica]|uniref:Uncharacterized protein n=1 Tax=Saxophila tyrrhenica TaxID=1690608 RepID=A0AAV9P4M5_9PEZI|nr:hypothetical protein LTR77_008359 [Saxophila tyrrhenica]
MLYSYLLTAAYALNVLPTSGTFFDNFYIALTVLFLPANIWLARNTSIVVSSAPTDVDTMDTVFKHIILQTFVFFRLRENLSSRAKDIIRRRLGRISEYFRRVKDNQEYTQTPKDLLQACRVASGEDRVAIALLLIPALLAALCIATGHALNHNNPGSGSLVIPYDMAFLVIQHLCAVVWAPRQLYNVEVMRELDRRISEEERDATGKDWRLQCADVAWTSMAGENNSLAALGSLLKLSHAWSDSEGEADGEEVR